jgi:hypothetical protein
MSGMRPHSTLVLDHVSHLLAGPDLPSKAEGFSSLCQQGRQLRLLVWTSCRWLMPQGFHSLHRGFLESVGTAPSVTSSAPAMSVCIHPSSCHSRRVSAFLRAHCVEMLMSCSSLLLPAMLIETFIFSAEINKRQLMRVRTFHKKSINKAMSWSVPERPFFLW